MKNDEQQPPPQGPHNPPSSYTGWSYDQSEQSPGAPGEPSPGYYVNLPNHPYTPNNPAPAPDPYDSADTDFQDMTMDFGTFGAGQTMGFHAISVPQQSQPIPRLRQVRLQQMREDQMRRQQRRLGPDATIIAPRRDRSRLPDDTMPLPITPSGELPEDMDTLINDDTFSTIASLPSSALPEAPNALSQSLVPGASSSIVATRPAAEPAQDTGMIQRIKVERNTSIMVIAFIASSVLGQLESFLFTYIFGATLFSDAYFQAYIIPNLIYTVVSGGALSSAFLPVFTSYAVGRKDEKSAWHIASSALNLSIIGMMVLSGLAIIAAPWVVPLYNPGASPEKLALIVTLTRIMLFQALVLGSGVIVTAVLNAKQDLKRVAIGTVLYNAGLIVGLIPGLLQRSNNTDNFVIYSATLGVVLAAILQVGVQVPGLFKVKMRYTFAFDWRHPGVRQIVKQMGPRVINSVMLSFSTAVDRFLLSFLGAVVASKLLDGLITEYFEAFSILVLPVSIFASSAATAAFPAMASYVSRGLLDRVSNIVMENLRSILFMTVPSAIGMIVLALPITQVLLEHGNYTLQDAQFTAVALIFFAIGLPALAAIEILTRAFYAFQDSRTPVIISLAQFVLKIALSIILINAAVYGVQWGMGSLALSTSIAGILEAIVLFILLYQRLEGMDMRALFGFFGRVLVAGAILTVVLLIVRAGLDHLLDTTSSKRLEIGGILLAIIKLIIELAIGAGSFLVAARLLKMNEMNYGMVRRLLNRFHVPWL